ncbi:tRNA (adenosine(37)-N6)-threonylcarbamoyltransferase complex ATPase subunit type 1 TsaE [Carnobacterium maltaromaticum]|uniref:tRNA (adenosine(37)-N6)-threonylcarbamoyltransferase complex ATPase subunit type 1 TsaE n=1 Tax=Carnobacterium maltaromaticum TaxID=2751 RepID=UPI000C7819A1|nr:tRNA (adenosine(37)-N6)-threonylcarbamoyltransferase complex ATPase subunit type 1 TsaE [Carnobacterium maltaromaticum]PLS34493.1 tRNA (adenosine(37)-N6)-threonylcarbamoyltransferase complex ATPase subunit type 1 TsaE [Carnobacterium maltaromaticum]PLS34998.1 tRNA (adenosine(37)-N6)-threonylcarbamoyltransferase complex ATPase subunit type 1 TsaE [Carnobacterium maltaromaticum]PLS35411.1 tRNA (adenosine(37)-N6)-threonylcarbamoyltransferase complex ATPase subunit type 1 TsaE [Carnobacterium mal
MKLNANNEQETRAIAAKLAEYLTAGDVILLEGNLGAGKTTFTKGLAEGLGIKRVIKSPTYTIIREYTEGRLPLYHMDVYRLEETGGTELGLEEYFQGDGVSIVEWATFIPEDLPKDYLKINLIPTGPNLEQRELIFTATGAHYSQMLVELEKVF